MSVLWIVHISYAAISLVYFVPDKQERNGQLHQNLTVNRCKTLIHFKCNKVQKWVVVYVLCLVHFFLYMNWFVYVFMLGICLIEHVWFQVFAIKTYFFYLFLCLHLFRINNVQVVVIAVIAAHKQPSNYTLSLFI